MQPMSASDIPAPKSTETPRAMTADEIHRITAGLCQFLVPELMGKRAYFEDLSRAIQQAVSIPVVLTGGITDVKTADDLFRDGAADLIGVGRSIFKDPGWAKGIP